MNELIETTQIKAIPAKVEGLDFKAARVAIEEKLKVYGEMVVTDENTPDIKKIIASLRKESKDLNDIKIKIKKELTKNVTDMETEFKALIGIYDNAILPLDTKVKAYEAEEYSKRKESVLAYAKRLVEGTGFDLADLEIAEKWFNKGTSEAYISEDVTEQIGNLNEKLAAITDSISSKNAILGTDDLKLEFYRQNLKNPLHLTLAQINSNFEALKARAEKAEAARKAEEAKKADEARKSEEANNAEVKPEPVHETVPFEPTVEEFIAPWDMVEKCKVGLYIDETDLDEVKLLLTTNGIEFTVM